MRHEARTFFESVLIPVICVCLPWRLCVRIFWFLCGKTWLFPTATDLVCHHARDYIQFENEQTFRQKIRFHLLVDQADFYLSCTRGRRWFNKYVRIQGDKIDKDQGSLFVTFHWGQGFWALKYFNLLGFKPAWLHAPLQSKIKWGSCVSGLVGKGRIAQVGRLAEAVPIAVGNSVEKMRYRLVEEKSSVMAMPDAPLRSGASAIPVKLLGRSARLPAGVIRMAASENISVYAYTMIVNPEDGMRDLRIRGPIHYRDEESLAQALADMLTEAIEKDPSAWYVWPFANSFFEPSSENTSVA